MSRLVRRGLAPVLGATILAGAAAAQISGPLPQTLSPEGRAALAAAAKGEQPSNTDIPKRRAFLSKFQDDFGALQRRRYAVDITNTTMAGVPVRIIRPKGEAKNRFVLLDMHGGGFNADSGSLTENIPIAALTRIPVVAVLYRLAPENTFPAAVDDGLAVYRTLLKTHKPSEIGLYGTSAGAIIGPQMIVRIRKEGLPQPAMLGMFSGDADFSRKGDTLGALGFDVTPFYRAYAGATSLTDPAVSPSLGDATYFPPTLCLSSSRDFYLSSTANFCRHLELAGVPNKFVVFDGLPHAFWAYLDTPESDQAFMVIARFIEAHLKAAAKPR